MLLQGRKYFLSENIYFLLKAVIFLTIFSGKSWESGRGRWTDGSGVVVLKECPIFCDTNCRYLLRIETISDNSCWFIAPAHHNSELFLKISCGLLGWSEDIGRVGGGNYLCQIFMSDDNFCSPRLSSVSARSQVCVVVGAELTWSGGSNHQWPVSSHH